VAFTKFLQYIKYIILEVTPSIPSIILLYCPPPIPGTISTAFILHYIYEYIVVEPYSLSYTLFPHPPCLLVPIPKKRPVLPFCFLISQKYFLKTASILSMYIYFSCLYSLKIISTIYILVYILITSYY
jgi:hypothetical protein